jgi:plasmid stabilization system protein ParE
MARRLVWTEKALETKKEIFEYWNDTTGNKKYSRKLETEFTSITDSLLLFPILGREIENYDARMLIKGDYSIFISYWKLIPVWMLEYCKYGIHGEIRIN